MKLPNGFERKFWLLVQDLIGAYFDVGLGSS